MRRRQQQERRGAVADDRADADRARRLEDPRGRQLDDDGHDDHRHDHVDEHGDNHYAGSDHDNSVEPEHRPGRRSGPADGGRDPRLSLERHSTAGELPGVQI
jgi:hypothetical protein